MVAGKGKGKASKSRPASPLTTAASSNTRSKSTKPSSASSASLLLSQSTTAAAATIATVPPPPAKSKKPPKTVNTNISKPQLYCICRTEYDGKQFMIACDSCQEWFHGKCVNVKQNAKNKNEKYFCVNCI
ncbi:hypothetical protein DFJ77DRAFT_425647, partial [Powellomyces hirtus]